jgi:UDP-glucose:(glucosyl)LPS alpha-1,2-glucosyltransferase
MLVYRNELTLNAQGGTELMGQGLESRLSPELHEDFQIFFSRVRNLDKTKIPILYCHDLPGDPESEHLANGGWQRYRKIVFVSNWQMQAYINHYGIPWSKCIVIPNAITPIEEHSKPVWGLNFIYHTTPHRGLNILVPTFAKLAEKHENIHLDVFSSFNAYGWPERDKPYEKLFKMIEDHPNMTNHGFVPNSQIREALKVAHVFAYPNTWLETSCIALIEAMSAQLLCIHPNLAALSETSCNRTMIYQWNEDLKAHAQTFYHICDMAITNYRSNPTYINTSTLAQKTFNIDSYHRWEHVVLLWESLLKSLKD